MAYQPIPPSELVDKQRIAVLIGRSQEATTQLLARLPDVAAYGFLLIPDSQQPAAAVVRDRWSELDHRSGNRFALVAFQPPAVWARALVERWKTDLGPDFDPAWQDWQDGYGLEPGAAYDYLDYFQTEPPLRAADLPCLVIFTSLTDRQAIVRPLPNWSQANLFDLLGAIIDEVREQLDAPPAERLDRLRAALTSPGARTRATLGHLADQALAYLKAHPATAVVSALSVVIALGTGNVLPLAPTVLKVLTDVRGVFSPAKGATDS